MKRIIVIKISYNGHVRENDDVPHIKFPYYQMGPIPISSRGTERTSEIGFEQEEQTAQQAKPTAIS